MVSGWFCAQLWNRSLFAAFHGEASASVAQLLISVLGPEHTMLYQHTGIMHPAWFVSWCGGENQGP